MNHERINIQSSSISCGVLEVSRISNDIDNCLYALATKMYHPAHGAPGAFIIASDVFDKNKRTNTECLFKTIVDKGFGEVQISSPEDNPKTGNTIQVYTCKINHLPWKDWYSKERVKRLSKVGV